MTLWENIFKRTYITLKFGEAFSKNFINRDLKKKDKNKDGYFSGTRENFVFLKIKKKSIWLDLRITWRRWQDKAWMEVGEN